MCLCWKQIPPILEIPDINSYNLYFDWYLGDLEQNDEFFDEYHAKYPNRVIGFSEYGADATPQYQSAMPEKGDYTESYQALYHEYMLKMIEDRSYLWATHVWNLFDFAADGRDEGGKHGENQKGLVTFDRKIKKDVFYLYKAAWNKRDNFVHICGSRRTDRTEDMTEIKVYSNQPEVSLYVDGNPDYTFIKRSPVTNWFDADTLNPECFSIHDTLGEIKQNSEAGAIIDQMMARGASERGDVADAVKDNPNLQRMMGRMTLLSLLKQGGADDESMKQINRVLQGIRKTPLTSTS